MYLYLKDQESDSDDDPEETTKKKKKAPIKVENRFHMICIINLLLEKKQEAPRIFQ